VSFSGEDKVFCLPIIEEEVQHLPPPPPPPPPPPSPIARQRAGVDLGPELLELIQMGLNPPKLVRENGYYEQGDVPMECDSDSDFGFDVQLGGEG